LGGIIFYGLSGCGKTYLSNAFASELGRHFFSFSPADIQSMWIGQTQKNIKDIFSQAQSKSPSLLFMDELESIGFSRNSQNAHTDQKATINQLLIEMNNIDESNVLVVGATNKISQLDSALKRSGRFDLKVPIFPPNEQERAEIFSYYLELLNQELAQKQRGMIEVAQVYFNYLGEESVGMTSSDIKTLMNRLRIDNLLKKPNATNADLLVTRVKKFIEEGQRTLSKDDVRGFIDECQRNDQYSPKIEFLLDEWNL
jgi:SpoVK/Ycf46/Vps4 family AAA+-type ATPase